MMKQMRCRSLVVSAFFAWGCMLVVSIPVGAQQEPTDGPASLTLEQALEMAEARSEPVVMARAGIARADADRIRARSNLASTALASASYDRALASEFEGVFGGTTTPTCAPFALNQQASIDTAHRRDRARCRLWCRRHERAGQRDRRWNWRWDRLQ
jgi:hypothetical protein